MEYAIIAAGEGSRLAREGVSLPKPLVRVAGEPLIDRLCRIFMLNDASRIHIITPQPSTGSTAPYRKASTTLSHTPHRQKYAEFDAQFL